jgi:serine/threonine protein kinase
MIDFGLVSEYLDANAVHKPYTKKGFTGTPSTGSINALNGRNHSRRDDMESLGYCFMYTVNYSAVPWN